MHNPNCDGDHCRKEIGEVRLLPIGGDGNIIVCQSCYAHEMKYRRNRIALDKVEFDLPKWEALKLYEA
jgi:hypothetical protein